MDAGRAREQHELTRAASGPPFLLPVISHTGTLTCMTLCPEGMAMPTISMFYGILVLMYYRDNRQHHLPHIHVRYQDHSAAICIDDGRVLDGSLPARQLKMVQAWVEIHKEELMVDWELAVNGEEPFRIAPLQ